MFPPVSTEVLAKNPQFKELYTEITTQILNPHDGSTRETREAEATATASLEQVQSLMKCVPKYIHFCLLTTAM